MGYILSLKSYLDPSSFIENVREKVRDSGQVWASISSFLVLFSSPRECGEEESVWTIC